MLDRRGVSVNQQKGLQGDGDDDASSNISEQNWGTMPPWAACRAEEQRVDDVQPGKVAVRGGH
jgi:hypothetical protein